MQRATESRYFYLNYNLKRSEAEKRAIELTKGKSAYDPNKGLLYGKDPVLYINSTENMGIIKDIVKPNGTVLVPASSGDFSLGAAYCGARYIVAFDVSKDQYFIAALKLKAQQVLEYEDFYGFFCDPETPFFLSKDIYEKIKAFEKGAYDDCLFAFNDVIMNALIQDIKKILRIIGQKLQIAQFRVNSKLYSEISDVKSYFDIVSLNNILIDTEHNRLCSKLIDILYGITGQRELYLQDEEAYNQTRENVSHATFSFVKSNIANLNTELQKTTYGRPDFKGFDTIYLSNIPQYITSSNFPSVFSNQVLPLLNDDGEICFCLQGVSPETLSLVDPSAAKEKIKTTFFSSSTYYRSEDLIPHYFNSWEIYRYIVKNPLVTSSIDTRTRLEYGHGGDNVDSFVRVRKR